MILLTLMLIKAILVVDGGVGTTQFICRFCANIINRDHGHIGFVTWLNLKRLTRAITTEFPSMLAV